MSALEHHDLTLDWGLFSESHGGGLDLGAELRFYQQRRTELLLGNPQYPHNTCFPDLPR